MKNFVQKGGTLTVVAPEGGVVSGQPLFVNSILGVCVTDAVEGAEVEIAVCGVFDLPKVSGESWAIGQPVFWDPDANVCTTNESLNVNTTAIAAYVAGTPEGLPATIGRVKLNQ